MTQNSYHLWIECAFSSIIFKLISRCIPAFFPIFFPFFEFVIPQLLFLNLLKGASNEEGGPSDSVPITIPAYEKVPSFQPNNNVRKWEIQKSIVLGGLIESITSLVIVTSAASVDISNGNCI